MMLPVNIAFAEYFCFRRGVNYRSIFRRELWCADNGPNIQELVFVRYTEAGGQARSTCFQLRGSGVAFGPLQTTVSER